MEIGNGWISDGAGSLVCLPAPRPPLPATLPPPTNSVWPSPGYWPPRTPGLDFKLCPLGCLGPWMPDQLLHPSQDHIHFYSSSSATGSGDERYPDYTTSPTASAEGGGGCGVLLPHGRGQHTDSQGLSHHLWGHLHLLPASPGPHLGLKTGLHKEPLVTTPSPPDSYFSSRWEKHMVSPW